MSSCLSQSAATGLERSCNGAGSNDWVRVAPRVDGVERVEAYFSEQAFSPHRHNTYAVGLTTGGVQCFGYRGVRRQSLPGEMLVLHPDEQHDGGPGTDAGFRYKIFYIDPALIQDATQGKPLPFVADPVLKKPEAENLLAPIFDDFDKPLCELRVTEIISTVSQALNVVAAPAKQRSASIDVAAVSRARDYLVNKDVSEGAALVALEAETGLDRWRLTRHFQRAYGTSPYRFFQMRRLQQAQKLLQKGTAIAEAAAATGFADQSHLTRQFKRAYGLSPGRWIAMLGKRAVE